MTAGEGGAWGMAILAGFAAEGDMYLEDYLEKKIFSRSKQKIEKPNANTVKGFNTYVEKLKKTIEAEKIFSKV